MPSEAGRELIAARPDMRVLLMSGYTEDHLRARDPTTGGVYFIAKPFSGAALSAKIRSILFGAAELAEPESKRRVRYRSVESLPHISGTSPRRST